MLKWLRTPARLVPIVFLLTILLGTFLLMLPIARSGSGHAPFMTAFFVATSAVAVTGLSVVDSASYWSGFGQAVMFGLFQIGGVGIMSSATLLVVLVSRRLSLARQIVVTTESRGIQFGDVRIVLKLALAVMLSVEAALAAVMVPHFQARGLSLGEALWQAIFHAGAAFTNAGFSIYPGGAASFLSDPALLIAIMIAVFVGGLGLPVYYDLKGAATAGRKLSLHTKLTLATTILLYLLSMVLVLIFEWGNPATLQGMAPFDRFVNAAYHGFMARSCGMNVIDMTQMTEETMLITYGLMFIGGGSASTAGGLKVTTVAILLLAVWHQARGDADLTAFGRRVSATVQREALSVLVLAFSVLGLGIMALRLLSDLPLRQVVFEAISAFANVGLSMNSTANLTPSAQFVVIVLMFIGRVGTITVAAALALRNRQAKYRYPEERPIVG